MNDGLPQLMCVPCVLQVSRAFTFKQVCQRSDQTLRQYFQDLDKSLAEKQSADQTVDDSSTSPTTNIDNDNCTALSQEAFAASETISPMKSTDGSTTSALHDLQSPETFTVQYTPDSDLDNNNLDKCLMIVSSDLVEHIKLNESETVDMDGTEMSFSTDSELLGDAIIPSVHSVHAIHPNTLSTVDAHELKCLTTTNPSEHKDSDLTSLPLESDEIPVDLLSETYGKFQ